MDAFQLTYQILWEMTSFRQLTTIFTFDDRKEHVSVHWCVDNEILQSHEIEDIFVYSSIL